MSLIVLCTSGAHTAAEESVPDKAGKALGEEGEGRCWGHSPPGARHPAVPHRHHPFLAQQLRCSRPPGWSCESA